MTTEVLFKTPPIRYSLSKRGRRYSGVPRDYNVSRLVQAINGPVAQERVRTGSMLGYYGHWPRLAFGADPSEGGIVDGKHIIIEPAVRICSLKADPDGMVEHETEFLDTEPGRKALNLYKIKVGGFSQVIHPANNEFWGCDYVTEPNYLHNGPAPELAVDSASAMQAIGGLSMDDVKGYYESLGDGELSHLMLSLDSAHIELDRMGGALQEAHAERDALRAKLAQREKAKAQDASLQLDAASLKRGQDMLRRDMAFLTGTIAALPRPPGEVNQADELVAILRSLPR